jgi:hypothetical protein
MDKLTPGHNAHDRLADATRTGRIGRFEITYRDRQGTQRILCMLASGFEDAAGIFAAYDIGEAIQTREISHEAFLAWYQENTRRVRKELGLEARDA